MTLKNGDLRDLVYHILEIDSYRSKMGSDEDIVTLSFSAKTKESADDLADFIEKGYDFVLDADATPGEQSDGTYKVFVEIEREKGVAQQITELAYGVSELTGLKDLKFRYYKDWKSQPLDEVSLEETIPIDKDNYSLRVSESNLSNYTNFFNKSFVESVDMFDYILRIKKAYAEPVFFEFVEFGNKTEIMENLSESLNFNDFPEVIYLTKYIGDYDITKYGDKLVIENNRKALVVKRIIT
jgi:hypothetical protein